MMNILVLSGVLPAPIERKKTENDIILTTANLHKESNRNVTYTFVYVTTYSNFIFSKLSPKWKQYKELIDMGSYDYEGNKIEVIAVPGFEKDSWIKSLFVCFGYKQYKNKLEAIIIKNKINIIHAHDINSNAGIAYQLYKKYNIPYIITSRRLGIITLSPTLKKYIQNARAIINLGEKQKKISDTLNSTSYLIPHGIDEQFTKQNKDIFNVNKPIRFVTISRLLDWKNIDKVFYALESIGEDFVYDIYGEGPHLTYLKQVLNKLEIRDKVAFFGQIPYADVPNTLLKYDVFVLPSYIETFGRVYIEAMACSLPIIAAKGGGIESYVVSGKDGFLINHDNQNELRTALLRFIKNKDLIRIMGKNAKLTSNMFSWGIIIPELNEVYTIALNEKSNNCKFK